MSFQVGQKVVCVCAQWQPAPCGYLPPYLPKLGCEYTVRSIQPADALEPSVALRLHWLINPAMQFLNGYSEPAFSVAGSDGGLNFRPVVETETDISIFTDLLLPNKSRELISS